MLEEASLECEKCNAPKLDQQTETDARPVMEDMSTQTMGSIPGWVYLPGTEYKEQMLKTKGETEASGQVLISETKEVNRANWQYPNFISQAYCQRTSIRFISAMGITVPAFYDAKNKQDAQQLSATIKQHLTDRDAKRADADMFRHLMRTESGKGNGNQATTIQRE